MCNVCIASLRFITKYKLPPTLARTTEIPSTSCCITSRCCSITKLGYWETAVGTARPIARCQRNICYRLCEAMFHFLASEFTSTGLFWDQRNHAHIITVFSTDAHHPWIHSFHDYLLPDSHMTYKHWETLNSPAYFGAYIVSTTSLMLLWCHFTLHFTSRWVWMPFRRFSLECNSTWFSLKTTRDDVICSARRFSAQVNSTLCQR